MRLQSVHIRNFKAIVDSKTVKLGPLTAFIGHNGSGKSSLIEALETYQSIVCEGLDAAMQRWMGIEHARHKGQEAKERLGEPVNDINFELAVGSSSRNSLRVSMAVNLKTAVARIIDEARSLRRASDPCNDPFEMVADEAPDRCRVQLLRSTGYPALKQGGDPHQGCPRLAEVGVQPGQGDRRLARMFRFAPHR